MNSFSFDSMLNRITFLAVTLLCLLSAACQKNKLIPPVSQNNNNEWSVPVSNISGSLSPFDMVNHPKYVDWSTAGDTASNEYVLVFKAGNQVFVYPHFAMHVEAVNDIKNNIPFAITYCPQTGSGIAVQRVYGKDTLLLAASGYLYLDNLMPWDSISGSVFSQMLLKGVQGPMDGMEFRTLPLVQIKRYKAFKAFPDAQIFESNCKACLDSFRYEANQRSISRGLPGELRFGILGLKGVATFSYSSFADSVSIKSYLSYIVTGSEKDGFIMAFQKSYTMTAVQNQFPIIMQDDAGSLWDIFGEAISGPHKGEKLISPPSYVAHDWAWHDFFDQVDEY